MCGPRSDCSRRGSLGVEGSLICFYTAGPRGIEYISVEDKNRRRLFLTSNNENKHSLHVGAL